MLATSLPPQIGSTFGDDEARARRSDHVTSHEAADSNNVDASIGAVLATLRAEGPMTDEQLVLAMEVAAAWDRVPAFTQQRIRTARASLVKRGLVRMAGYYRLTATRRRAQVWEVSE